MIDATNFKPNINKLTECRIRQILHYVVYCYLQILADKKTYNYAVKGKIAKEEFLRNGLVNDYLQKSYNKNYFKQHISDNPSAEITFHPEETMTFINRETKKPSTDKIDIAVWENILQSIWSGKTDDEIRFAIECKRIERLSDASNYTSDMEKFCNRNHVNARLPFEGQIAFIENRNISHSALCIKINNILNNYKSIITSSFLGPIAISDKFNGTYMSIHQRNTSKSDFSIYHLLFDYTKIIVY